MPRCADTEFPGRATKFREYGKFYDERFENVLSPWLQNRHGVLGFCVFPAIFVGRHGNFSKLSCVQDIFRNIVNAWRLKIMVEHGGRVMYAA